MTEYLTESAVVEALKEIVLGHEGFVYESPNSTYGSCVYSTPEGTPSCIVGYVFAKLTPVFFAQIAAREYRTDDGYSCTNEETVGLLLQDEITSLAFRGIERPQMENDNVVSILAEAQAEQDEGATWGRALERALAAV